MMSARQMVMAATEAISQSLSNVLADAANLLKCEGNHCSTSVLIGSDDGDGVPEASDGTNIGGVGVSTAAHTLPVELVDDAIDEAL